MEAHEKIAQLLNVSPEALLAFDQKMSGLTGKAGILDKIAKENDAAVEKVLKLAGLNHWDNAQTVSGAVSSLVMKLDGSVKNLIGAKDGVEFSAVSGKLCETASAFSQNKTGFFIKRDVGKEMLRKNPPKNVIDYFGFADVDELLEKKELDQILCALRFAEDEAWMRDFFDQAYGSLKPEDFEERDVKVIALGVEWASAAEKFYQKKLHNVSHLKEFGIIFVYPFAENAPGTILRAFIMVLHYLNEVPFYAKVIRKIMGESDFIEKLKALLRGDVPDSQITDVQSFRIVQRYLFKVNPADPRLSEPHFNPEAEHWARAEDDLAKIGNLPDLNQRELFGIWRELEPVGDIIEDAPMSFNLEDLSFGLSRPGGDKFVYHQQESLWNKIFIEYLGHDRLEELVEQNMIKGFFTIIK